MANAAFVEPSATLGIQIRAKAAGAITRPKAMAAKESQVFSKPTSLIKLRLSRWRISCSATGKRLASNSEHFTPSPHDPQKRLLKSVHPWIFDTLHDLRAFIQKRKRDLYVRYVF